AHARSANNGKSMISRCTNIVSIHSDEFKLVHLARTLTPICVISEIAAMTIRPATSAYSNTSPPRSSRCKFPIQSVRMTTFDQRLHRAACSELHRAIDARPAGDHARANSADYGNGGDDDQPQDQGVLDHFTTGFVGEKPPHFLHYLTHFDPA